MLVFESRGKPKVRQKRLRPHLKVFNPPSGTHKDGTEVNMYQNSGTPCRSLNLLERVTRA